MFYFVDKSEIVDVQAGENFCIVLLQDGSLHAMGEKDRIGREDGNDHFYAPVMVHVGDNAKIERIVCCSQAFTMHLVIIASNRRRFLVPDFQNCNQN